MVCICSLAFSTLAPREKVVVLDRMVCQRSNRISNVACFVALLSANVLSWPVLFFPSSHWRCWLKVSSLMVFSVIMCLASCFLFEETSLASRGRFPDPFFRRYDLAAEIVDGELIEVKPSPTRIPDKMFEKFPDDAFMLAKIKIVKSWKGKLKVGQTAELEFARLPGGHQSEEIERVGESRISVIGELRRYYLRRISGRLVKAAIFGGGPFRYDTRELEAAQAGKSEAEIIKLMDTDDRIFYEKRFKKTGKIDRMAERPEWIPPPKNVQI